MNQINVFTCIFDSEIGQRFLISYHRFTNKVFEELNNFDGEDASYRGCLGRVEGWESALIEAEESKLQKEYPDIEDCFGQNAPPDPSTSKNPPPLKSAGHH